MREAIQKAIESGYEKSVSGSPSVSVQLHYYAKNINAELSEEDREHYTITYADGSTCHCGFALTNMWAWKVIDPLFWQALGKSLGWADDKLAYYSLVEVDGEIENGKIPLWHYQWHRFIDHLAEGKDPELFFKELVK